MPLEKENAILLIQIIPSLYCGRSLTAIIIVFICYCEDYVKNRNYMSKNMPLALYFISMSSKITPSLQRSPTDVGGMECPVAVFKVSKHIHLNVSIS